MKTLEERLEDFAIINEMYIRGVPMTKLEAFLKSEKELSRTEGYEAGKEEIRETLLVCLDVARESLMQRGLGLSELRAIADVRTIISSVIAKTYDTHLPVEPPR